MLQEFTAFWLRNLKNPKSSLCPSIPMSISRCFGGNWHDGVPHDSVWRFITISFGLTKKGVNVFFNSQIPTHLKSLARHVDSDDISTLVIKVYVVGMVVVVLWYLFTVPPPNERGAVPLVVYCSWYHGKTWHCHGRTSGASHTSTRHFLPNPDRRWNPRCWDFCHFCFLVIWEDYFLVFCRWKPP